MHSEFILALAFWTGHRKKGLGWGTKRTRKAPTLSVTFCFFKEI